MASSIPSGASSTPPSIPSFANQPPIANQPNAKALHKKISQLTLHVAKCSQFSPADLRALRKKFSDQAQGKLASQVSAVASSQNIKPDQLIPDFKGVNHPCLLAAAQMMALSPAKPTLDSGLGTPASLTSAEWLKRHPLKEYKRTNDDSSIISKKEKTKQKRSLSTERCAAYFPKDVEKTFGDFKVDPKWQARVLPLRQMKTRATDSSASQLSSEDSDTRLVINRNLPEYIKGKHFGNDRNKLLHFAVSKGLIREHTLYQAINPEAKAPYTISFNDLGVEELNQLTNEEKANKEFFNKLSLEGTSLIPLYLSLTIINECQHNKVSPMDTIRLARHSLGKLLIATQIEDLNKALEAIKNEYNDFIIPEKVAEDPEE